MTQFQALMVAVGLLVLSGVAEYFRLLPPGAFGYVFMGVASAALGLHIPLLSKPPKINTTGVANNPDAVPYRSGRQPVQ